MRRSKLAKRKATKNAAIAGVAPKKKAIDISRARPVTRLKSVPDKNCNADLAIALGVSMPIVDSHGSFHFLQSLICFCVCNLRSFIQNAHHFFGLFGKFGPSFANGL